MKTLLSKLIETLRDELEQYGEMLALFDRQQQMVMHWQLGTLSNVANEVNAQMRVIAAVRHGREQCQRDLAHQLGLPETSSFAIVIPRLPPDYKPLLDALVSENKELLARIQKSARLNHMLFSQGAELMEQLIGSISPEVSSNSKGNDREPEPAICEQPLCPALGC